MGSIGRLMTKGWLRVLAVFLVVWLILAITAYPLLGNLVTTSNTKTANRLAKALEDLEALRRQNNELRDIFNSINLGLPKGSEREALENFQKRLTKAEHPPNEQNDLEYIEPKENPSSQYENLRRRIHTNTKEIWNFVKSQLLDLQKKATVNSPDVVETVDYILKLGAEHKRSLLHDIEQLADVDGYSIWREKEANDLSNLVQARFKYLQNPPDCKTAKKLVCNLNKGCGYGCQIHHVVYCFMVAYGTKRTLILKSKGWRYNHNGWEDVFQPVSETCKDPSGDSVSNWPGNADTQVILMPVIDTVSPRPPYLPLAIPEDLAPRLMRLHGDPIVWWIGQFFKYLLRPQATTAKMMQDRMTSVGFQRPIVGVHVRRTDKVGTEASFHGVEEYMSAVEEYYDQLDLVAKVETRRIYLATDDPKVIDEAKTKYPKYEILADPNISKVASVATRYSEASLYGIIFDIHILSMSDYLVCTFSSQVCRVAYELMQMYYPDASSRFRSLDDIYYYGGQTGHDVQVLLDHAPMRSGEIALRRGDLVGIAGNHWNGFSKGVNQRTRQVGLFPSFKVHNKVNTVKYPIYAEVSQVHEEDVK